MCPRQHLQRELEIFEMLAAGEGLTDSQRVVKLYTAIQQSKYQKMASVVDATHLVDYSTLKELLIITTQVDPNDFLRKVLSPE